jgi:flagellar biosynthesis protein FliR
VNLFPDFERIWLFALLLGRAGGLVAMAPFFGERLVPRKVRILLVAAFAFLMAPLATTLPAVPQGLGDLVTAMVGEIAVGVAMGFLGRLTLLSFSVAGEIISFQMGFAMAAMMDPMQPYRQTVMGRWMWLAAMTLFMAFGGHHILLRALAATVQTMPPGTAFLDSGIVAAMTRSCADTFNTGMRIGAPALGILLITSTALGILARSVPQMNVFIVGFPLKITAGILGLMWMLPHLVGAAQFDIAELVHRLSLFTRNA